MLTIYVADSIDYLRLIAATNEDTFSFWMLVDRFDAEITPA
jgi:hypothetical protein